MLKYEMPEEIAEFLVNAVNRAQFQGENGAKMVLTTLEFLRNPINKEDLLSKMAANSNQETKAEEKPVEKK